MKGLENVSEPWGYADSLIPPSQGELRDNQFCDVWTDSGEKTKIFVFRRELSM